MKLNNAYFAILLYTTNYTTAHYGAPDFSKCKAGAVALSNVSLAIFSCNILSSPSKLSPKTTAICSSDLPDVSGTNKYEKTAAATQNNPKKRNVPHPSLMSISGTTTPMIKFASQFMAVAAPTPLARLELGNTSAGRTQARGPYETAYASA